MGSSLELSNHQAKLEDLMRHAIQMEPPRHKAHSADNLWKEKKNHWSEMPAQGDLSQIRMAKWRACQF